MRLGAGLLVRLQLRTPWIYLALHPEQRAPPRRSPAIRPPPAIPRHCRPRLAVPRLQPLLATQCSRASFLVEKNLCRAQTPMQSISRCSCGPQAPATCSRTRIGSSFMQPAASSSRQAAAPGSRRQRAAPAARAARGSDCSSASPLPRPWRAAAAAAAAAAALLAAPVLATELEPYVNAPQSYSLGVPAGWERKEKAGADVLFEDPERR